jgi:bleomycin hydrolase
MGHLKLLNIMLLAVSMLLSCCGKKGSQHHFTEEVKLPTTPIKNQGKTELCWAYAMLATIETEHIMKGDSVNLSATYIGRKLKEYQQSTGYRGKSQRGMGVTLLNMLPTSGAMDYDVLPDDAPDNLPTPQWVFMLGAKYSPQEFAHSICAPGEYEALTCWPDSPYYNKVEVPTADNWEHNRLLNLPIDTLLKRTERAVRSGHPVCWESKGHAMAIIGIAHDEQGKKYFIMKNSWGSDQPNDGLVYMSYASFRKKTLAIVMNVKQ